jgi:hypothetical protein
MANKWYYKHGVTLPTLYNAPTVVVAPDDNVVGNVRYIDPNHPNASDTATNRGCANVPYKTHEKFSADSAVTTIGIYAKGVYTIAYDTTGKNYLADVPWSVVFKGTGTQDIDIRDFHGIIFDTGLLFIQTGGASIQTKCIYNTPIQRIISCYKGLILKDVSAAILGYQCVFVGANLSNFNSSACLFYNCVRTITTLSYLYSGVYWLGTLNYNSLTSDLNTICPLIGTTYPTENDAIAKVETDLGLAANTLKNNGFRLLNPHFINIAKGNFNIDWLNYDCTAILTFRDSWDWIINRGVRNEYPLDFVGAVGAGFGEEPNLADGFGGELYSRNINSSGAITNTAYDTVLVSKKYTLPQAYTLENVNFFDKLLSTAFAGLTATENTGTDTPNCYTYYLIGVKTGTLESVFNSTNNTFSYSGVLTCDFPRFMWNRSTQLNKDDNTIYGQIENGTYDLNYMRNIYNAGVKEFRLIAVKKGV